MNARARRAARRLGEVVVLPSVSVSLWERVAKRWKNSVVKPSTPAAVPVFMERTAAMTLTAVRIAWGVRLRWLWRGSCRNYRPCLYDDR